MPITQQIDLTPAGIIKAHGAATAPNGYLKCNGAAVSRTTYAALFAAIGTTWGAGDGSTTFNVPELRGEFLRGLDDGRGIDTGRALNVFQAGDIQSHTHIQRTYSSAGGANYRMPQDGSGLVQDSAISTQTAGGTETRPRNQAALFIIKF